MPLQTTPVIEPGVSTSSIVSFQEQAESLAKQDAIKYGVSFDHLWATISCEDPSYDPTIQSGYYKNGIREKSYGLAQINLPKNPDVSYKQATDPVFSINFMAQNFALGNADNWTCWREIYLNK